MTAAKTSPQQRSDLARKAAHARWSRVNVGQAVSLPSSSGPCEATFTESIPPASHCEASFAEAISPAGHCEANSVGCTQPQAISSPKRNTKRKKRSSNHSWLDERFCLSLHQDPAGQWLLRTPSDLDLPATHSEISLWLDLQTLIQPA